jgi:hypothetical protein
MAPGEEREINSQVRLIRGLSVHNLGFSVYIPPGFDIITDAARDVTASILPDAPNVGYAGWTRAVLINDGSLTRGLFTRKSVTIRAPQEPGGYALGYTLTSDEYQFGTCEGHQDEFPVEVNWN